MIDRCQCLRYGGQCIAYVEGGQEYCHYCKNSCSASEDYLYIGALSARHKTALRKFVAKFVAGAHEHGDIDTNKKWTKEMLDEEVDGAFYRIFKLIQLEEGE